MINWTERLRNEEIRSVKEDRNIVHTINREKPNWIGHMLRRNFHLKHLTERKIEGRIKNGIGEEDVSSYCLGGEDTGY